MGEGQTSDGMLYVFRAALGRLRVKRRTHLLDLGLYEIAMAAGRLGAGGFAPAAVHSLGRFGRGRRRAEAVNEAASVPPAEIKTVLRDWPTPGRLARHIDIGGVIPGVIAAPVWQDMLLPRRRKVAGLAEFSPLGGVAGVRELSFAPVRDLPKGGDVVPSRSEQSRGVDMTAGPSGRVAEGGPGWLTEGVTEPSSDIAGRSFRGATEMKLPVQAEAGQAFVAPVSLEPDLEQALDEYFFRKSRLPPVGGAGFNPFLSPAWAGLKMPG